MAEQTWLEGIKKYNWNPKRGGIIEISYRSSMSGDIKSIYYSKSAVSMITYSIKYKIEGENIRVEYTSLQISNISSDTDLINALKENQLTYDYRSGTPRIKDMLQMEKSEEANCTDLNQCGILSILIWIDMLAKQPETDAPPSLAYDSGGCFCQYTGKPPPAPRIQVDSMEFLRGYCHVNYRLFEFVGHSPSKKTIMLYNTKDGVRAKSSIFVNQIVQSEEDMLEILRNNLIYSIEYRQD
jgi:hypothetical protein